MCPEHQRRAETASGANRRYPSPQRSDAVLGGNSCVSSGTASTTSASNLYSDPKATTFITLPIADFPATSRPSPRPRRKSWLSSVRHVLCRSTSVTSVDKRYTSLSTTFEQYCNRPLFPAHEPYNHSSYAASSPPRRAVSDPRSGGPNEARKIGSMMKRYFIVRARYTAGDRSQETIGERQMINQSPKTMRRGGVVGV